MITDTHHDAEQDVAQSAGLDAADEDKVEAAILEALGRRADESPVPMKFSITLDFDPERSPNIRSAVKGIDADDPVALGRALQLVEIVIGDLGAKAMERLIG